MPAEPTPLDQAILRALAYADVFDYALAPAEILHYLPAADPVPQGQAAIEQALADSSWLKDRVELTDGLVTLGGRSALAARRAAARQASALLWPAARRWAARIASLPCVRLVAVTGALAVNNPAPNDDIDLLIVTEPGRVWLARALVVGLVRLARRTGVHLCPNYVLSRSALAQGRRDLFVAHDLLHMVPLSGLEVYAEMRQANRWAQGYLPHALQPLHTEPEVQLAPAGRRLQRLGERLLAARLGDRLEAWERGRKLRKFQALASRPGSAAQLDAEHVKGHFEDHGRVILAEYQARLARLGLAASAAD